MGEKEISRLRIIIISIIAILLSTMVAIIVHAVMPANVNAKDFDSILVKLFGFSVVAILYFVILFTHCASITRYFGKKSDLSNMQIGMRFGLAFSMIYLFGMQEVVVEASPFTEWGLPYVRYQFFMGIGDAIPALLLCIIVAKFTMGRRDNPTGIQGLSVTEKLGAIALITATFLTERAIGYETGFLTSNCDTYPVACYGWTILFGIVLGVAYVMLYPIFSKEKRSVLLSTKLVLLTLGINWVIFNSFIGMIYSGAIGKILMRSGLDIMVIFFSSIVIHKWVKKEH